MPGLHRIPSVAPARPGREAGGAQGVRSIRIAQGTVNKLGGGALRGSARVRAALLHSGRPGSRPTGAPKDRYNSKPAGGVPPPDPRRGEGRHSARRRRQRRRPAARGARRGPARTTKTHHPTAPLRTPPRASAHAPPRPLPGAGRSPYQPHECQLAIPPPAGEGEQRTDQICALAIKQLTTAGGPYAGARSSFHGVPDSQQRVARAPAAAPTAARRTPAPPPTDFQPSPLGGRTHPARKLIMLTRAAD